DGFEYQSLLPLGEDTTHYRCLSTQGVSTVNFDGETILKVEPEALTLLSEAAMYDIAHFLRTSHLEQLSKILNDPEATPNDRFVALELLKNANSSAGGILPMCQDTGTAIIMGKRGQRVFTAGKDEAHLSRGVYNTY